MMAKNERRWAERMDQDDPLREMRARFFFPQVQARDAAEGKDVIYMAGNSLGLQPKGVEASVIEEIEAWQRLAVGGHLSARRPWVSYHETLQESLASLVGAKPQEVVASGSLTANLHFLLVSFYRPTPPKAKIVMEAHAFPSDRYALASQIAYHGFDPASELLSWSPRPGEDRLRLDDLEALLQREEGKVALLLLGGVNYYTGQVLPMKEIAVLGRKYGAIVGFDLAHAIGNVPLQMHGWDADFAVWCSYKYLNGGPGAVAGLFVHERYAQRPDLPRFAGWWGNDPKTRFQMRDEFQLQDGAGGWMVSNAPVLSMAALRPSLEIFQEAGMTALREKSLRLTGFLLEGLRHLPPSWAEVITPAEAEERGCQVSLRLLKDADATLEALKKGGVVCDRRGDVIRFAPTPLYSRFQDVWDLLAILKQAWSGERSEA